MPLMKQSENLGRAYRYLDLANQLHVRIHGIASGEALYNMACCLSLGAPPMFISDQTSGARDIAPGLPPVPSSMAPQELAANRLDQAAATLEAAVEAGYVGATNMQSDPDLDNLRLKRPSQFAAILHKVLLLASNRNIALRPNACVQHTSTYTAS